MMPGRLDNVALLVDHVVQQRGGSLVHVTDERNLRSIAEHGLLSKEQIEKRGVAAAYPGGNDLTWALDRQYGLWDDVFLSFHAGTVMPKHDDDRDRRPRTLRIDPRVLFRHGVRLALGCANHKGTKVYGVSRAVEAMDHAAFLGLLDPDDLSVRWRIALAHRYEILAPSGVPPEYILSVD